jgi:hypothetical protein
MSITSPTRSGVHSPNTNLPQSNDKNNLVQKINFNSNKLDLKDKAEDEDETSRKMGFLSKV